MRGQASGRKLRKSSRDSVTRRSRATLIPTVLLYYIWPWATKSNRFTSWNERTANMPAMPLILRPIQCLMICAATHASKRSCKQFSPRKNEGVQFFRRIKAAQEIVALNNHHIQRQPDLTRFSAGFEFYF